MIRPTIELFETHKPQCLDVNNIIWCRWEPYFAVYSKQNIW